MIQKRIDLLKSSWQESVAVLAPQSIGRIALLSLRTLFQIYTTLPFAWFFPTALCAGLLLKNITLLYSFYVVLLARAARPSLEQKKTAYWTLFSPVDWLLFAVVYAFQLIPTATPVQEHFLLAGVYKVVAKVALLESFFDFLIPFMSPLIIVWVLFMLDSQRTVGQYLLAGVRALRMFIYNYPFFLSIYLIAYLITYAGSFLMGTYIEPWVGWTVLLGLLFPLYIACITVFYVKRIHEQFALYY